MARWGTAWLLALLVVALLAPGVGAHALLSHSDPASGAVLQRAPSAVVITFTEQPEPTLSVVHVLDSAGRQVEQGPAKPVPGRPLELTIPLGPLPQGVYTVSWRTVSRIDGHVTGGAFAFGIGIAPSLTQQPTATSPPPSVLAVGGRWGLYAGLSGLLGAAWVWLLVFPKPPVNNSRYLWSAWALAAAGIALLGIDQAAGAGVPLGRLLATPLGYALLWRAIPVAAAAVAIGAGHALPPSRRRAALAVVGVATATAMLTHVLGGHAGASPGAWRWPNVADQWVHFAAVGTWMGGLAALLVALRGAPDPPNAPAVRRFSAVAGIALGVVAGTGILRAVADVGSWSALVSSGFGRLVLLKAALLIVLAALGAVNRYWNVPAAGRSLRGLRRVGGMELCVTAGALVVVGVLTGLAPPSLTQAPAGPAAALVISGSDFATSVRVEMEIAPGFPGINRFTARIVDYDTGRPVAADRVNLRFETPDRPDIGPSTLDLARVGDGAYAGQGANLSLSGRWSITVTVQQAATAVSVPLTVDVRGRPQTIRTISAPGQPTLYGIDLPGGRLLDFYLDPDRPGFNEVHATFIDASGIELPVPQPAVITVRRPGRPAERLPVRRFGPGHFIGDAQLAAGDWEIEVIAADRSGAPLLARLTIHL